jgi:hypothetical protein
MQRLLLCRECPSLGPVRKRNKTGHIAYKLPCSCGEARSDRFCIPSAYENSVRSVSLRPTLCPNNDVAMIVPLAHKAWSSERDTVTEALKRFEK